MGCIIVDIFSQFWLVRLHVLLLLNPANIHCNVWSFYVPQINFQSFMGWVGGGGGGEGGGGGRGGY